MESCDQCASCELELRYRAPSSQRGLSVYVCRECGLVQSLPRTDHIDEKQIKISTGADWGNVRYGKAFRTEIAIRYLKESTDISKVKKLLDVGANRGSFIQEFRKVTGKSLEIWAVEPDSSVLESYEHDSEVALFKKRIENVALPHDFFDLIYCSHTLEHVASPNAVLNKIWLALKNEGVLFLEVPNIAFIQQEDIVEEWFIDKHLFHFSKNILISYLLKAGFELLHEFPICDDGNISIVARKSKRKVHNEETIVEDEYDENCRIIEQYKCNLIKNRKKLERIACALHDLVRNQRVAIWGAGRLLDGLVKYGNLDLSNFCGIVDKFLPDYVTSLHNMPLSRPRDFLKLRASIIFVASRSFSTEIANEIANYDRECKIMTFSDMMESC